MPIHPKTAPELVAEIQRRHAEGQPVKAICIDLGVTATTVAKYTREDHPKSPARTGRNRAAWNGTGKPVAKASPQHDPDLEPVTERKPLLPSHESTP